MFRRLLFIAWLCALAPVCHAQLPTFTIVLGGDSILYQNAPFRFVEVIDARYDTTKLGFLKEGFDASSYQLICFPQTCSDYVLSYIDAVVNESIAPASVAIVMHNFSVTEEPLGAIEIAKARVHFTYYLVKNGQYKKIREINTSVESPAKDVTDILGEEMEKALRTCVKGFLKKPNTEGENTDWVSKEALLKLVMPKAPLTVAPVGELDYAQGRFWLNGKRIDKREALAVLENTEDQEILSHIKKYKSHGIYSKILMGAGVAIVGYTLSTYIGSGDELNGMRLVAAMGSFIPGLLASKSRRHQMHLAVDVFNQKYNR